MREAKGGGVGGGGGGRTMELALVIATAIVFTTIDAVPRAFLNDFEVVSDVSLCDAFVKVAERAFE